MLQCSIYQLMKASSDSCINKLVNISDFLNYNLILNPMKTLKLFSSSNLAWNNLGPKSFLHDSDVHQVQTVKEK